MSDQELHSSPVDPVEEARKKPSILKRALGNKSLRKAGVTVLCVAVPAAAVNTIGVLKFHNPGLEKKSQQEAQYYKSRAGEAFECLDRKVYVRSDAHTSIVPQTIPESHLLFAKSGQGQNPDGSSVAVVERPMVNSQRSYAGKATWLGYLPYQPSETIKNPVTDYQTFAEDMQYVDETHDRLVGNQTDFWEPSASDKIYEERMSNSQNIGRTIPCFIKGDHVVTADGHRAAYQVGIIPVSAKRIDQEAGDARS